MAWTTHTHRSRWSLIHVTEICTLSHINPLATLVWKDSSATTVDEAVHHLEEFECMAVFLPPSTVEKLLWTVLWVPAVQRKYVQLPTCKGSYISDWLQVAFSSKDGTEGTATGYPVVLLVGPLTGCEELRWKAYLNPRDTSTWITATNKSKLRIFVEGSCSSGRFLRQCGKTDVTSDSMEKSFNPLLPEILNRESCEISIRGALPGGGEGQPDLLDCVYPMAWNVGPTGL